MRLHLAALSLNQLIRLQRDFCIDPDAPLISSLVEYFKAYRITWDDLIARYDFR